MLNYENFKHFAARADESSNRRIHFFTSLYARYLAFVLYRLGFTPNLTTWLFGVIGILGVWSFYNGYFLIGYLFWRLHIAVDMADGDIARATKTFSVNADGFDRSLHVIVNISIVFALCWHAEIANKWLIANVLSILLVLNMQFTTNFNAIAEKKLTELRSGQLVIKNLIGFEAVLFSACFLASFYSEFYHFCLIYGILGSSIIFVVKLFRQINHHVP